MTSQRALTAAALFLALAGAFLLLRPTGTTPEDPDSAAQSSNASPPSAPEPGPTSSTADGGPTTRAAAEVATQRRVVEGFAVAFTAPVPQKQWLTGLEPHVTTDLLAGFELTSRRARPTGVVTKIRYQPAADQFRVDYKGGDPVLVDLAPHGRSWRVTGVAPVPPPDPPSGNDL